MVLARTVSTDSRVAQRPMHHACVNSLAFSAHFVLYVRVRFGSSFRPLRSTVTNLVAKAERGL